MSCNDRDNMKMKTGATDDYDGITLQMCRCATMDLNQNEKIVMCVQERSRNGKPKSKKASGENASLPYSII